MAYTHLTPPLQAAGATKQIGTENFDRKTFSVEEVPACPACRQAGGR